MALVEETRYLVLGYGIHAKEVSAQAGTGVSGGNNDDDLRLTVTASQDCRIVGIDMIFPLGSDVSARLTGGLDLLINPAPTTTPVQLVDAAKAALVEDCSVGAGRVLMREGKGALVIEISGAIAGLKRIVVRVEPLGGGR